MILFKEQHEGQSRSGNLRRYQPVQQRGRARWGALHFLLQTCPNDPASCEASLPTGDNSFWAEKAPTLPRPYEFFFATRSTSEWAYYIQEVSSRRPRAGVEWNYSVDSSIRRIYVCMYVCIYLCICTYIPMRLLDSKRESKGSKESKERKHACMRSGVEANLCLQIDEEYVPINIHT